MAPPDCAPPTESDREDSRKETTRQTLRNAAAVFPAFEDAAASSALCRRRFLRPILTSGWTTTPL